MTQPPQTQLLGISLLMDGRIYHFPGRIVNFTGMIINFPPISPGRVVNFPPIFREGLSIFHPSSGKDCPFPPISREGLSISPVQELSISHSYSHPLIVDRPNSWNLVRYVVLAFPIKESKTPDALRAQDSVYSKRSQKTARPPGIGQGPLQFFNAIRSIWPRSGRPGGSC